MRLTLSLALRDLMFNKTHLICNIAVLAGVLVPLMVLFGVKNGVYDALLGEMLSNPQMSQIDTSGNSSFTVADAETVRGWPEAGFVTLKTRSQFDFVNVRKADGGGLRDAILIPSGTGDPSLPDGLSLGAGEAVLSARLASQIGVAPGTRIDIFTQAENRPRQLRLPLDVVAVLPPGRASGRAVFTDIAVLDLVEAFYDGYALPDHGIEGTPLDQRAPDYEGIRVYAVSLDVLASLQNRIEARFGISTEARTAQVENVLRLGRNLNLALLLTAGVACIGLVAALVFGFWGEVQRKRQMLASLALMGLGGNRLWIFPVCQALVSAGLALIVSFGLLHVAGAVAERMFETGLAGTGGLVRVSGAQAALIALAVTGLVVLSSLMASRAALRIEPATVLREGVT
ncbi:MAG: ABC transporter permease [Roseovarius sp.]|nr:ABC transporter permease [Roseovarius sp.]